MMSHAKRGRGAGERADVALNAHCRELLLLGMLAVLVEGGTCLMVTGGRGREQGFW